LLDQIVGTVGKSLEWKGKTGRCENLPQLAVELEKFFERWTSLDAINRSKRRLVLVFDGIDRQREAPVTLLPALARLGEIVRLILMNYSTAFNQSPDTQSHNDLYRHLPSSQLLTSPRSSSYTFSPLCQIYPPGNSLSDNSNSTTSGCQRYKRNMGPVLRYHLGFLLSALRPRYCVHEDDVPASLA
jgi:origin recognition complex subunit 5